MDSLSMGTACCEPVSSALRLRRGCGKVRHDCLRAWQGLRMASINLLRMILSRTSMDVWYVLDACNLSLVNDLEIELNF